MSINFPEDLQLIFIGEVLRAQNDGVMESVLRKIKFIEDNWGHRPILLTAEYRPDLASLEARFSDEYKQEGQTRLNADTRVFGVFDYFLNSYPYNQNLEVLQYPKCGDETLQYKETSMNVFDVYNGEKFVRREHFTLGVDGRLGQIDLFDENMRLSKSMYYDYLGYMTKAVIWDPERADYHPTELYYTTDKKLRIRADYNCIEEPKRSKIFSTRIRETPNELVKYTLYDNDRKEIGSVPTHEHLLGLCLDGITGDPKKKYIICDENHLYGSSALIYPKDNVANATVIHNIFLNDSSNLKSEPQPYYKHVCDNRRKFDAVIHLTNQCKKDFEKIYGISQRNFVITHPYPFTVERADFDKRNHKKAIIAARFFPQKRLDRAIEIFALVLKEVPDATLDLYGFGPDEQSYRELIDKLGIGENVKLKGYTDQAAKLMSESACFIMTSYAEGLGLTLLESTSNGCPPFAYDIKYGPSDVINNNVTGFIFKEGDKRSFAKQLIKYFNDIDMQKRMSENCYEAAHGFSVEVFLDKYWAMTEKLYKRMINTMN